MIGTVQRDSYVIHYHWSGNEINHALPVIVFSHALGSDLGVWEPQCKALAEEFRILRYDHPGHGQSSLWSKIPEIQQYGEDVSALLDHLDLESVHFCGLSLGGMVGQWLGARAPNRFRKMIFANTCAKIANPDLLKSRIEVLKQSDDLGGIAESVLNGWFTREFQEMHPDIIGLEKNRLLQNAPRAYAATAKVICELDLRNCATEIEAPVLVVAGRNDHATPPEWNRELASLLPRAGFEELPAAHLSNVEAADQFSRLVREFLKE